MLEPIQETPAFLASLVALVLLTGCGDGEGEFTVNVAGSYTVAVTNRSSTCDMENFMVGAQTPNIPFDIRQNASELDATVGGLWGGYVAFVQGSAEFEGSVRQNELTLTNYGTNSFTQGDCSFTYNATISGELNGNAIAGTITYSPDTSSHPACASVECATVQEFSGSRPPP